MPALTIDNLSFSYGSRLVFERISMRIGDGERVCFIGPNGCGKTTLLRVVSGHLQPDGGHVQIHPATAVAPHVVVTEKDCHHTVEEYCTAALRPLLDVRAAFDHATQALADGDTSATTASEYNRALHAMESQQIWTLEDRVDRILAGLNAAVDAARPLSTLSPGQRARLTLALTLAVHPPVLLLDEPTTHLDVAGVDFLSDILVNWGGPVLIASHDRAFIEGVATSVADMNPHFWDDLARMQQGTNTPPRSGLYLCRGTYSHYRDMKRQAREQLQRIHAQQQAEKRRLSEHRHASHDISRGGVHLATAEGKAKKYYADRAASTAGRRIRADDQHAQRLRAHEVRKPRHYDLTFPLPAVNATHGLAVSIRQATVEGRLAPVTADIGVGEHLLIAGANGVGKTTLLSWIAAGRPPADAVSRGTVSCVLPVGYVPQCRPQRNDDAMAQIWDDGVGEQGRGILHPSHWNTPLPLLSAGNQRRAQIAMALAQRPHILVCDEPTNYLDLDSIDALEEALRAWSGTLIVASHDRWLIDHWQGSRLTLNL